MDYERLSLTSKRAYDDTYRLLITADHCPRELNLTILQAYNKVSDSYPTEPTLFGILLKVTLCVPNYLLFDV